MKDAVHHLKHIQRKVIQSVRKELKAETNRELDEFLDEEAGYERLERRGKRFRNSRRRLVRMPTRSRVH